GRATLKFHGRPLYYDARMAMGKLRRDRQPSMWVATTNLPAAVSRGRSVPLVRDEPVEDLARVSVGREHRIPDVLDHAVADHQREPFEESHRLHLEGGQAHRRRKLEPRIAQQR